ncbi:MAG TPA: alpha/beta hydrolase [Actinokineospora sp.]|nr:alpha/beta hydrolase [Actinokineospora sp.]
MSTVRTALVIAVVMLASACADPADPEPALTFTPCGDLITIDEQAIPADLRASLTYECGKLAVPVDYAAPGEKIDIHVVRVRSSTQHDRIGSLIVNFGGPGVSGLQSMGHWPGAVSGDVLGRFDLVSFDPRGTGRSAGIRCPDLGESPDVDVSTEVGFAQFTAEEAKRLKACADHLGGRAEHFNTTATARDMEAIRSALGDDKLTYVGYSYGAKLGAEYADSFPDRVRAVVLDAPSDQALDGLAVHERAIAGFEDSFARYADSCSARPSCAQVGDPREMLADVVAKAATSPIPAKKPGDGRLADPNDILSGVVAFLYADDQWPYLDGALLAAATDSDSTEFFAIDDGFDSGTDDPNIGEPRDAGYVINCNDSDSTLSDEEIKAAVAKTIAKFPVFGRWSAYALFGCKSWPAARHPLNRPKASGAAPILVVGTVHDPATPYAGAVSLAGLLDSGRLLTWDGDGHTAYHQSICVDRHVDDYLISLTLPPPDTHCA